MPTVYEIITERMIELIKTGVTPWRKTWESGRNSIPANLISGKNYRGINTWLLLTTCHTSRYFLTLNQAKKLGVRVKYEDMKNAYPVVYFKLSDYEDRQTGETRKIPMLRYYKVWNVEQLEKMPNHKRIIAERERDETAHKLVNPIDCAEHIVSHFFGKPEITHGGTRAYYMPSTDTVNIPAISSFESAEAYYATLWHELGHATGHETRLDRPGVNNPISFGSHSYSKEELIAEMCAAFLCGISGIANKDTEENSAAYLQGWINALRGDSKLLVAAASQAQKATDFILKNNPEYQSEDFEEA